MSTTALILAAGFGKRMHSKLPKVLHQISGDSALLWVLRALPTKIKTAIVVIHHGKELIEQAINMWLKMGLLSCSVITIDQGEPLGTGHAVQQAIGILDNIEAKQVLILCGDVPLIRTQTIADLITYDNALLAMNLADPTGYGRISQCPKGNLESIVEHKDASEADLNIKRVNGGAYAVSWQLFKESLGRISNNNANGEYYLTDAIVDVTKYTSVKVKLCNPIELTGMNTRKDQAYIQSCAKSQINDYWMDQGITFIDTTSTTIGPRVKLNQDVLIGPNVCLTGQIEIGPETTIGQGCILSDCSIGKETVIKPYCIIHNSQIGDNCIIGPFAHLRYGNLLKQHVHVGNFVEIKKTTLNNNVKANHLSYLGDTEVGERSNIGAGLITCNYDGFNKHNTVIGKDVFVGSGCQLIAPVTLGDQSIIGAGSTITDNIPSDALALTRTPLITKFGAATYIRQKKKSQNSK